MKGKKKEDRFFGLDGHHPIMLLIINKQLVKPLSNTGVCVCVCVYCKQATYLLVE